MKFISNNDKETIEFAKKYAKNLKGGEVIGLIGNLGAGKTNFTKGLALGLGIKNKITSPTFVVMKVYQTEKNKKINKLIHIDAYRLSSMESLSTIGLEEYLEKKDNVIIIEWADRIKKFLPKKTKFLEIKINQDKRTILYD